MFIFNLFVFSDRLLGRENWTEVFNRNRLYKRARRFLKEIDFNLSVREKVKNLSLAEQRMVEIGRALSRGSRIIILDEPTASFTADDVNKLFKVLINLRSKGISFLYISHRMEELLEIADKVTVLRDGEKIGTTIISEESISKIVKMMIGKKINNMFPKRNPKIGEVVFKVKNLSSHNKFSNINLTVKKGEIVGITGLVGSGKTELAMALFGSEKIDYGEIFIEGDSIKISKPRHSIKNNIVLIPEDRKKMGIIGSMSIGENILLPSNKDTDSLLGFFISRKKIKKFASNWVNILKIATTSTSNFAKDLSGGNQQKVVLAKWLNIEPKMIILDEPTIGIDVGAKFEVFKILNELALKGKAILLISSEIEEVINMSDRVILMKKGKIIKEYFSNEISKEKVLMDLIKGE